MPTITEWIPSRAVASKQSPPEGKFVKLRSKQVVVSAPKAKLRRKSKRGKRRRRGKTPRQIQEMWGRGPLVEYGPSSAPIATSSNMPMCGYRRESAPIHKEWGEGMRMSGTSYLGAVTNGSGSYSVLAQAWNQFDPGASFVDPYTIPLHPGFIDRPNIEIFNWSRYRFRKIRIRYLTAVPTTYPGAFIVAFTRDTYLAALFDATYSVGSPPPMNLFTDSVPNFFTAFWKDAAWSFADNSDRTFPTIAPYEDKSNTASLQAATRETAFQGHFLNRNLSLNPSTTAATGILMADYEIDFYGARLAPLTYLSSGTFATTTSSSSSSVHPMMGKTPLKSEHDSSALSRDITDPLDEEKFIEQFRQQIRLRRLHAPPRSSSLERKDRGKTASTDVNEKDKVKERCLSEEEYRRENPEGVHLGWPRDTS
jgi:hypothetical protein